MRASFLESSFSQWMLGDLAKGVVKDYGEKKLEKYANDIKEIYNTLRRYRDVAKKFEIARRHAFSDLSFTHFQSCAGQDDPDPEHWLKLAHDNNWSCERLREEIQKFKEPTSWLRLYDVWNFQKAVMKRAFFYRIILPKAYQLLKPFQ